MCDNTNTSMHSPLLGYHLLTSGSTATHYSTKYTKTVTTSCQILIHNTSWIIAQNLYATRNTCIQTVGPPSLYMLEQKRVGVEQRTATTFKQAIATNTHNTAHKRHTTSKSLSIVALLVIDKKNAYSHKATKHSSSWVNSSHCYGSPSWTSTVLLHCFLLGQTEVQTTQQNTHVMTTHTNVWAYTANVFSPVHSNAVLNHLGLLQ